VEGLSGAAALYTLFAVLFTCCLGGFMFFAFIGIVANVLFIGAFIAIAILTRGAWNSCDVDSSEDASGPVFLGDVTGTPTPGYTCKLEKAVFVVACVTAYVFLLYISCRAAVLTSIRIPLSPLCPLPIGPRAPPEQRETGARLRRPRHVGQAQGQLTSPNVPVIPKRKKPPAWKRQGNASRDAEFAAGTASTTAALDAYEREKRGLTGNSAYGIGGTGRGQEIGVAVMPTSDTERFTRQPNSNAATGSATGKTGYDAVKPAMDNATYGGTDISNLHPSYDSRLTDNTRTQQPASRYNTAEAANTAYAMDPATYRDY
jgi:hypothetical protein